MIDVEGSPVLKELEEIVSSWPNATYEKVANEYPGNTVIIGIAHFPSCAASTVEFEVEAVAGETAGDGYEIRVKSKQSGETVWFENWERSMKYFPDGAEIKSANAFADFCSNRIRTLLHLEWVLVVCYGFILQKKVLVMKAEKGWQVDSHLTWFGSRLLVDDACRVFSHVPWRDV